VLYLVQLYIVSTLCIFTYCLYHSSFSCPNAVSYLWQMVHTHTSDFVLDVFEGSGACRGVAPTGPRGAAPEAPPPPPPPATREHQVAASHAE
jgi:hypothetical protein